MYSYERSIQSVLGNAGRNGPRDMQVHTQYARFINARSQAVKWKWRESGNAFVENSRVTPYYIFQMPHGIGFLGHVYAARVNCVVRHVLRCVVGNEIPPVPSVAATILHPVTI